MLATDTSALIYQPATPGKDAKPVRCTARPVKGNLRPGDAWVVVGETTPSDFLTEAAQEFIVYISLGADEVKAEEIADSLTVPFLKVGIDAGGFNPLVRRMQIIAGEASGPGSIYALALTLTVEISA